MWAGPIDLEHGETGGEIRSTLSERVQACAEDHVLSDAEANLFRDEILNEASARHDGRAERPRELAHVGTTAPSLIRSHEPQPDFVVQNVRRRIDRDVQRPPQGDAHSSVVGLRDVGVVHVCVSDYSREADRSGNGAQASCLPDRRLPAGWRGGVPRRRPLAKDDPRAIDSERGRRT